MRYQQATNQQKRLSTLQTGFASALTLGSAVAGMCGLLAIFQGNGDAMAESFHGRIAQQLDVGSLTVQTAGLRSTDGQICFTLYDRGEGFPDNPEAVVDEQCVSAAAEIANDTSSEAAQPIEVTFDGLEAGASYAIAVLHDENEDSELNQGQFGIPTEGFGFSQNPEILTGPPEFSEAAVIVIGQTTVEIEMIYF